jgi:hypothetical protein
MCINISPTFKKEIGLAKQLQKVTLAICYRDSKILDTSLKFMPVLGCKDFGRGL